MTTFSEVRVLGPGTTEANQISTEDEAGLEEGQSSHGPEYSDFPAEGNPRAASVLSAGESPGAQSQSLDYHHIAIGSLVDTRLRMRRPLTLEMDQEGEFYIAKCDELNEFGYDYDPIGAVQDVRVSIAELYWELKENQHRLGADLAETWRRLSELVYEA